VTSGKTGRELITFVFALSFLHEMWDATAKFFLKLDSAQERAFLARKKRQITDSHISLSSLLGCTSR
jgi:hypothetical protein